jgi:exopolyphosphatase/guanosine-5'-triphosphate,3'-diphosphate pyrophosphatase
MDEDTLSRARIIGAAVRAADVISAGMPGVISQAPMFYEGDKLVLRLPKKFAALEGERLDARFALLAGELDREHEIRIGEDVNEPVTA